jgi:phage shock protein A
MRALFGGMVEATEDPELILQQTIRDMRDRIPDLNNSVAQVMATEKLLAKNQQRLETQVVDLDSKIKASVKMGRDDIATAYIGQLQQAQVDLQKTVHQHDHAELASKQALKARDNYMLQMQRRTAEAMQLINQSKQAKLQEQLAQTMASFQIGDDAGTFDEMRDKIDRRAAAAEARSADGPLGREDILRIDRLLRLQDRLLEEDARRIARVAGHGGQAADGSAVNQTVVEDAACRRREAHLTAGERSVEIGARCGRSVAQVRIARPQPAPSRISLALPAHRGQPDAKRDRSLRLMHLKPQRGLEPTSQKGAFSQ